jgi:hypothetical protein
MFQFLLRKFFFIEKFTPDPPQGWGQKKNFIKNLFRDWGTISRVVQ